MKLKISLLIPAVCFLLIGCQTTTPIKPVPNQSTSVSAEQLLRKDYVSTVDKETHQYFVYLPRGYADQPEKKWPVMLFLHGNGERGNGRDELDYVISHGPLYEAWIQKKDLPFIIISPQLPMFGMEKVSYIANRTRAQIPQRLADGVPARDPFFATQGPLQSASLVTQKDMKSVPPLLPVGWDYVEQDLLGMLNAVQQLYRTDAARLYLTGLSYGGFGTWFMASKHPDMFAAIAPVVGWGHPDLMAPIASHQVPVWAFAGGRDTAVNKKFFYPGLAKLEELGDKDVRFTVEEDMAHDTWKRVYARDDLYQWLLEHTKK
ncbi:MAG: alpha/beta hydrolase [Moraxellaceae bacterium]|nr:MAG: alpha/beta hydrolase [Moraxellaceae bacterium]